MKGSSSDGLIWNYYNHSRMLSKRPIFWFIQTLMKNSHQTFANVAIALNYDDTN